MSLNSRPSSGGEFQRQAGAARRHVAQQHQHGGDIIQRERNASAGNAEPRHRAEAEDQQRRAGNQHHGADQRHHRRHAHIARAAQRRRLEIDDPYGNSAREQIVGIFYRGIERAVAAAERLIQRRAAPMGTNGEDRAHDHGQHHRMQHQRIRVALAAGAGRPRHRGSDAAAQPAVRHHRHQHEYRKHQCDAGQCVGSEIADIIGFGDVHRGLRDQHGHGRQRQPEQGRQHWPGQNGGARLYGLGRCAGGGPCDRGRLVGGAAAADRGNKFQFAGIGFA